MKRKLLTVIMAAAMFTVLFTGCGSTKDPKADDMTIVKIPKLLGTAWFDQMLPGLEKWVGEHGGTYYQSGPSTADAALQLQSVEDAITEGVSAIHVVPNSTETLEVAFKKAKDAVILGSVQAQTHVEWADAAVAYQEANYPDMHLVADYVESGEDHDTAYNKTKELIKTYPDLKGIIGCSVIDPAGAALAVEEAGMEDTISIVGTSIVDVAGNYLDTGAIDMISLWDTEQTSYAMCEATRILAQGGEVKTGDNLGAEGYESVTVDGHVIYGTAWIDITKDNKDADPYITQ